MAKPTGTRRRILDVAESAILSKGFGATSIDEIVAAAEITKGGFFYHFADKSALASALLVRYIENEDFLLNSLEQRARDLTDDPLQGYLVGLKLLAEMFADLPNGHPGCLVATATYQERMFSQDVRDLNRQALTSWRVRFRKILDEIAEIYPPQDDVSLDDVADMLTAIVDGGIVLARAFEDPKATSRQVLLYRSYIKLLFRQPTH